jgi:hypothetical protein
LNYKLQIIKIPYWQSAFESYDLGKVYAVWKLSYLKMYTPVAYSIFGTQNTKSRRGTKQISKEMVGIINFVFRQNLAEHIGFAAF